MWKRVVLGLAVLSLFGTGLNFCHAGLAGSGDPFVLYFDENGNGSVGLSTDGGITFGPLSPLTGALLPDPTQGGKPALTYILPELVNYGDVRVWEPGSTSQILSDLMRFTDAAGNLDPALGQKADRMIYYSDVIPGESDDNALADTGFPATLVPNDSGGIQEVGSEGANGFDWFPGGNVYHGISDVPEPATIIIWSLLGGLGIAIGRWHLRRAA
jgi:hypothetical protein